MPKICKKCNITKEDIEFSNRQTTCKECYNAKRREERKLKQKKINLEILPHLCQFQETIISYDGEKININNIIGHLQQLLREAYAIKEQTLYLSFPYELPTIVHTFLRKCIIEQGVKLRNVRGIITNKALENDFPRIYGVEQNNMMQYLSDIINVSDTVSGIYMYYNNFIDEANCSPLKPDNYIKIQMLPEDNVFYNFTTSSIDIYRNPLNFDEYVFFSKIKADKSDISKIAFHELGIFDNYYTMYNV